MAIPLVVLAAGLSSRYGRLKQLDPLGPGGESIMDYNVFDAVRAGFDRIVFVVRSEIEDAIRGHVDEVVGNAVPVDYVNQTLDDLPVGYRVPPDRARPWGTGHATLAAARVTGGAFGVCNADDLYGPDAFTALHGHLASTTETAEAVVVGYTLAETLSGVGGVSRGVCVLGTDGSLATISEMAKVQRTQDYIMAITMDGTQVELSGREKVSMNLWGFAPPVIERFTRQFRRFLDTWGADPEREFYLSTEINRQIQVGSTTVRVLHAHDRWIGVTHPEDRDAAVAELLERVKSGIYPERLADGFRKIDGAGTVKGAEARGTATSAAANAVATPAR